MSCRSSCEPVAHRAIAGAAWRGDVGPVRLATSRGVPIIQQVDRWRWLFAPAALLDTYFVLNSVFELASCFNGFVIYGTR